jgi:hypothetical protein
VARERRRWMFGASARGAVAVAWALALATVGCGGGEQQPGAATIGTEPCVDVAHVDARQTDDLEVIGSGFGADEGHMIRILVTHGEPTYGLGEAPIKDGAFAIYLPSVLGDYTGIAVHVDRIRNNACDIGEETVWQITTGPASARGPFISESNGHSVWKMTPDAQWVFAGVPPCNLNGIFDLTTPLACK